MRSMKLFFSAVAMLLFTTVVFAQTNPDNIVEFDLDALFGYTEVVYGALIIVGGYLSAKIPFIASIPKTVYRVLAWAILTGIGFVVFGTPVLSLALTYFISTSLYEVILKPVTKGIGAKA